MLSRWFNSRLKAAEQAAADGRLDEAVLRIGALRAEGSAVPDRLAADVGRQLVARARVAAQAGRYRDALDDLNRLGSSADADAQALRQRVEQELKHRIERHVVADEAAQRAAEKIHAGRLESGIATVERIEDAHKRERLREELDIRIQRSDELVARAREALSRADVVAAARCWDEATRVHGSTPRTEALRVELVPACQRMLETLFENGKLDRFEATMDAIAGLVRVSPVLSDFERLLLHVRRASRELPSSDQSGLREALLRVTASRGRLAWIDETISALDSLCQARQRLLGSPLALLADAQPAPAYAELAATRPAGGESPRGIDLPLRADRPTRWLVLVDGTGSALLISREVVRLGRAGGSSAVDLALPADIQSHHADIVRRGDEHFLVAHGAARVNQRPTSQALLKDNDRVVLGEGCKFVYRKPSAKSETAVLMLADRSRLPGDVSMVVLFRQTCLLGPAPSCHIRTREGQTRLVIFERDGLLMVRHAADEGRPRGPAIALPIGVAQDCGDVRITVKPALA